MQKKDNKSQPVEIALGILAFFFTLACVVLLFWIAGTVASADARVDIQSLVADPVPDYERNVNNMVSGALEGLIAIPKEYKLSEDITVAPKPDPYCYGASGDPSATVPVIASAARLLDGQDMIWSPDTEIMPNSEVSWYLDDTILSVTWKQVIGSSVYTFSEVKVADASQFRRYMADDTFASPVQYTPTEMARTVNAVVALSGDYYKFRNFGIVAYRRTLYRAEGSYLDTCFVDGNGDLNFVRRGEMTSREAMEQYIAENDILFSLAFGPVLIENGQNVVPSSYLVGEIKETYSRSIICQLGDLHYLLLTVNREGIYNDVVTLNTAADVLVSMGVPTAYTLDGGQTASLIMFGNLINNVNYGSERSISDIIFFATAIPEEAGGAG